MSITIEPMIWGHIDEVLVIEQQCFGADAWTEAGFWSELEGVPVLKDYVVALGFISGAVSASHSSGLADARHSAVPDVAVAVECDADIDAAAAEPDIVRDSSPNGVAAPRNTAAANVTVLGYAGVQFIAPESEVLTVAVHPQAQRQGIGRMLIAHLEQAALTRECEVLHLEVESANEPARRMYAALGYLYVGRRANYYGPGRDAVLMSKRIGAVGGKTVAARSTAGEVTDV